jgi:hypothetical protein
MSMKAGNDSVWVHPGIVTDHDVSLCLSPSGLLLPVGEITRIVAALRETLDLAKKARYGMYNRVPDSGVLDIIVIPIRETMSQPYNLPHTGYPLNRFSIHPFQACKCVSDDMESCCSIEEVADPRSEIVILRIGHKEIHIRSLRIDIHR